MKSSLVRPAREDRVPTPVRQLTSLTEDDDERCVGSVERGTEEELMAGLRIGGCLFFLLGAGCVRVESAPPREPAVTSATQGGVLGVEPTIQPATPSTTRPTGQSVAKTDSPGAKTPSRVSASPEQRLRDTKAIGVFTKISLKNQVDDLLSQCRAFQQGRAGEVLSELRERYNLLLLKVLSLLQDSDPVLARAIAASREAVWGVLADPAKFATLYPDGRRSAVRKGVRRWASALR